jgi:hypothetical protein
MSSQRSNIAIRDALAKGAEVNSPPKPSCLDRGNEVGGSG